MESGERLRVDVEHHGWAETAKPLLETCKRVGLVMREDNMPRVWLDTDGNAQYFSRVIGRANMQGGQSKQAIRIACVSSGSVKAWLHYNGLVEVGPEPTTEKI